MKQLIGLLSLCVCAAQIHAQRTVLPPSCGNAKAVVNVSPRGHGTSPALPKPGTARAIFIERADRNALPVITRIGIDGTWVGGNRGDSYFEMTISPGEHHVCADWELPHRYIQDAPAFDVFTAEAGKTYYFLADVTWTQNVEVPQYTGLDGHMALNFSQVNRDQGLYLVFSSKVSTSSVR